MVKFLKKTVSKFIIFERNSLCELVCEFLLSPSKTWYFLNISALKLEKAATKEIFHKTLEKLTVHDSLNESSIVTPLVSNLDGNEEISRPLYYRQSISFHSQPSLKHESNLPFQSKLTKAISKIDRLKKNKILNYRLENTFDMINEYNSYFKIDASLNTKRIVLSSSKSKPFCLNYESSVPKKESMNGMQRLKSLHFSSKSSDVGLECIQQNCNESIARLEKVQNYIRNSQFVCLNIEEKYGRNILFEMLSVFHEKIKKTEVFKYFEGFDNGCSGLSSLFNCKINTDFLNEIYEAHKHFKITKQDYEVFKKTLIETTEQYDFSNEEKHYLDDLIQKLSKEICIKFIKI